MDLDSSAAQREKELRAVCLLGQGQPERTQALIERRNGVVADGTDPSFAKIHNRQRLQDVIELSGGEIDGQILIAMNARRVLEIADAVLVEHNTFHGKARGVTRISGQPSRWLDSCKSLFLCEHGDTK